MRIRVIPERYLAYVEGAIERAMREIEDGKIPDFMDDAHLQGTAVLCLAVAESPAGCASPERLLQQSA